MKTRTSYTVEQKLDILRRVESEKNLDKVARDTQINRRNIQKWRANKDKLLNTAKSKQAATVRHIQSKKAKRGLVRFPVLESNLVRRSTEQRAKRLPAMADHDYKTLTVSKPFSYVAHIELDRPSKGNAMNEEFWKEMTICMQTIQADSDIRVAVISGRGKIFNGGLDLSTFVSSHQPDLDIARRAHALRATLEPMQQAFSAIEKCSKPVIAAIHSACVGGGVDLTTACDIRFISEDGYFQVKEVDLGLAADVGTLQRLPKIVGNESFVKDICYTARKVYSQEALQMGLVSRVLANKQSCLDAAMTTAKLIAEKSPVAIQTSKESLNYSRDHPVADSLNHVRLLNQCMLQSEDVLKSAQAMMNKEKPVYSKL